MRAPGTVTAGTAAAFTLALLATTQATAQERESIFDRVVHLESAAITEIPPTPRLGRAAGAGGTTHQRGCGLSDYEPGPDGY